jgi:uncharacterized protein involved in exopolysaccharide biosynthesis
MAMEKQTLSYWIELLDRRRVILAEVAATVFGLVVLVTVSLPPVYQSSAEILIQRNRAQLLVSPDLAPEGEQKQEIVSTPVSEEELNSERELLASPYLVRKVIEQIKPPVSGGGELKHLANGLEQAFDFPALAYRLLHDAPAVTPEDRLVQRLTEHLGASVIKRSDIIEVTFRSHRPEWSEQFLNRLIAAYMEFHGQLSHDPQAQQFFRTQATLLQRKLQQSEDQLRAFQLQTGISDLNQQRQALISQESDLQLAQARDMAEMAAARQQIETLRSQLAVTPRRIGKESRSVQNLALQSLKPQVMQLKAERAELLSRYQPTSERIAEIDAKLAAAQRILDHENHLEVAEVATDVNPLWLSISTELDQAKVNAASQGATIAKLTQEIRQVNAQLGLTVNDGVTLGRLEQQVATDRQAYLSYVRKAEEARAAGALNTDKILNVSVAEAPRRPLRPVFPKVWLNLTAGLLLALLLGGAAAEWEERHDPKIRSSFAIARETGLQTLAVLHTES